MFLPAKNINLEINPNTAKLDPGAPCAKVAVILWQYNGGQLVGGYGGQRASDLAS